MATRKKTNAEKKAGGSYRPGRDGLHDPPPGVDGVPERPEGMTPSQNIVFDKVCKILHDANWLKVSDGATIHAFAIMQDRLNKNADEFTAADFTQFRMLAHELGLSPAARAKMPKVEKKKTGNPFEDL
jgi:hypothetical protein